MQALDDVDFDVRAGEIHALLGQNGAGKSTLIKVLTGAVRRDAGTITFRGRPIDPRSPADAQTLGIHCVYQEINLVPTQSVAENLLLGRLPRRWWGLPWSRIRRQARELLARFNLHVNVDEPLGNCPLAVQQIVALARAVHAEARLLIFDEPTSSLDHDEAELLFALLADLRAQGLGIIYITHFLDEVHRISDRATILRNGRRVGTFDTTRLTRTELVAHLLGHEPVAAPGRDQVVPAAEGPTGHAIVLQARGLSRRRALPPFDLTLRGGEVLGLAGLLGSGRTEIARLLFGADSADSGYVQLPSTRLRGHTPRQAISAGLALCPEDRKESGIFADMSVRENISIVAQRRLSRWGLVSRRAQQLLAEQLVRQLGIDTPDLDRPLRHLSGGNQQKVILARWLAVQPAVLILDEPTRGIDVGAKAEIEALIDRLAAEGLAVLFISSELEEVVRRSRRVLILRDRRIVGELADADVGLQRIMEAIAAAPEQAGQTQHP